MDPAECAARLEALALATGFDRAGVATLERLEHGEAFRRWLQRGEHAGMGWLTGRVEDRLEPKRLFPGARSVLSVALQYHPIAGAEPPEGDLWPGVARYARGRDYHNLVLKRLRKLARKIRAAFPGCETLNYVDTGPVLERALAARAGLGVVGKNTCLLSREGSWFVLAEIVLSLELAPGEPLTDLCGRCTRCLEACPTGAFVEPYRLDANRCISYWTIEHRGAIPAAMRPEIGHWVFGCDVCQEVCPWNLRPLPGARQTDFDLGEKRRELGLVQLLALSLDDYTERFTGNAMQRAGLAGLKRNAATVMGNRAEPRYVPALAAALDGEPDPAVRCHAAWALGRIGDPAALAALDRALARETDAAVLAELRQALRAPSSAQNAPESEETGG